MILFLKSNDKMFKISILQQKFLNKIFKLKKI